MRAWLPSRRAVESHRGACVTVFSGQVRSGRSIGGNWRYRWIGMPLDFWVVSVGLDIGRFLAVRGGSGGRHGLRSEGFRSVNLAAAPKKEAARHSSSTVAEP